MSNINQWVVSPDNSGHTCWATDNGGLPKKKPLWQLLKCAKYGAGWEFCATESYVYINSADLLAVALDIHTGEKKWEVTFPDESTSSIAISASQICIPPYVLDRETGKIIEDITEAEHLFLSVEDVADSVFYINTGKPNKGLLCYNNSSHKYYDIPPGAITSFDKGKKIIGIEAGQLVCYLLEEKRKLWSVDYPVSDDGRLLSASSSSYMVIDYKVYMHINYNTIRCVDANTGNIFWQSGPSFLNENEMSLYKTAPSRFLGCSDMLYLGRNIADDGFLQARSILDGSEQWRISAPQARIFLIAGDLLFGSLSDVPVAWDRYTGEVVWTAAKSMTAIFHAVAASNKIIYTNTMSQMRCYEWTEPYHSPAKG